MKKLICFLMFILFSSISHADAPTLYVKKITYNAFGQKTKVEFGNGVVTTNTFDPLNMRLKRIYSVSATGQILQDLSYTYDSAGNILNIVDAVNTATQSFKYDALNRLTEANGSRYGLKTYQYDPIGNIVRKENAIYSYAEGGAGKHAVTSINEGASGITTMTYDANGNMATKQKGSDLTKFIYDTENRLIEIKKNGFTTAKYAYDGDGGRVKKTTTMFSNLGSTTTRYVGSLFEETNNVKTRHILVGDMKVASITGDQQLYYLTDHLGGTNVITDKLGAKKELTEYEPYGGFSRRDKYGTGAEVAKFYFTGQRYDEESGLHYYNARYYDPKIARFITADSIVQDSSNPQTFNRYSYVGNNPINNVDPSGHSWFKKLWKTIVGIAVGIAATMVLGPGGALAWYGSTMAGAVGGALGGAVSGALSGGWKGALIGAAIGGAVGGLGGKLFGGSSSGGSQLAEAPTQELGTIIVNPVMRDAGGTALSDAVGGALASGGTGITVGQVLSSGLAGSSGAVGSLAMAGSSGQETFMAMLRNRSTSETISVVNALRNPDLKAALIFKLQDMGFVSSGSNQLTATLSPGRMGNMLASADVPMNTTLTIDLQSAPVINGKLNTPLKFKVFGFGEGEVTGFTAVYSNKAGTINLLKFKSTNNKLNNVLNNRQISFQEFFRIENFSLK